MRYFIKTFGCQMNVSDSERIAGFLEMHKLKPAKDIKRADLVIFNTCGVRQSAENRTYGQIHNARKNNPKIKIILTGCLANRKDVQKRLKEKVDLFIPIEKFFKIGNWKLIENCKLKIENSYKIKCDYLHIPAKYSNKFSAYVPIMTGCNNFCSYCVVPYARGREISRPVEDIIAEIDKLAKDGCKEITLLGQNVNSYRYIPSPILHSRSVQVSDLNRKILELSGSSQRLEPTIVSFPNLLNYLAKNYPQIKFKFLTSHPKDFSDELIDVIAKNRNISREIHLPIQSGSDKILKLMNRPYTRKIYISLLQRIKKKIPDAGFTTDVIVGFPGETQIDFQKTVEVFKKIKYNEAYINKYSPRPGTAAQKFNDSIPLEEKKRREKILRKFIK